MEPFGVASIWGKALNAPGKFGKSFGIVDHGSPPKIARFRAAHAAPMPYGIGQQSREVRNLLRLCFFWSRRIVALSP
jgi:hypothetical protein